MKQGDPVGAGSEVSVLGRMGALLGMFSETCPFIVPADVEAALCVSAATAYRYLGDMIEMGLVSRVSGAYAPGPRVLELGYLMRRYAPALRRKTAILDELAAETGCHVLLSRLYGSHLVNIYHAQGRDLPELNYVTGRRLPRFAGSQPKVVLAFMERRRGRRLYESFADENDRRQVGRTWAACSEFLSAVRRDGHYISRNELDSDMTGIAVPVFGEDGRVTGALTLVFLSSASPEPDEASLLAAVRERALVLSRHG